MSKKKQYCSNCNKYGHSNKECNEPITSSGIICINVHNNLAKNLLENSIETSSDDIGLFNYQRLSNINKIKKYKNKIKFLLVQRKHSLNYINFIRGIYNEDDYDNIEKIFSLMSNDEIKIIKDNNFDYLWNNLWEKTARKKIYQKEYYESKIKFDKIKKKGYIDNLSIIGSKYNSPEWEFPKGRKNINESNYNCAIREFYEETGINKDNYHILNNIPSIHDDFIGTNNMKYKHIFYISLIKNNNELNNNELNNNELNMNNIKSKNEISKIKFCSWDEALRLFRSYNTNKINIINKLFLFFINLCEDNNILLNNNI
jgi:ADP-ribose pyrophosphatase YjhB (NUDIX family)